MNGKAALFWLGIAAVALGAGAPILLPEAPAAIQSNAAIQSAGSFLVNNGNWIAVGGLAMILIASVA